MPINIKDSGTYKVPTNVYVKDSGSWKEAIEVFVNDGGTWKSVHTTGFDINASTGYNSITGITYTDVYTHDGTTTNSNYYYKQLNTNYTSVDYFLVGSGGGGGAPANGASNAWIGGGGNAGMVMFGRIPISFDTTTSTRYLIIEVPATPPGHVGTTGFGRNGRRAAISMVTSNTTTSQNPLFRVEAPGGLGGHPGDGTHGRSMYYDNGLLCSFIGFSTASPLFAPDFMNVGPSDDLFGPNATYERRFHYPVLARYSIDPSNGSLVFNSTAITEEDDIDADTNSLGADTKALIWDQNTAWKVRLKDTNTGAYSVVTTTDASAGSRSVFSSYPDDTFTSSLNSDWHLTSILATPGARATGYAGTFRGETTSTSNGIPQNQSFSRTSGAQGTGSTLTGWSGDKPLTNGGDNGTGYGQGQGGTDNTTAMNSARQTGSGGIVMLKFNT